MSVRTLSALSLICCAFVATASAAEPKDDDRPVEKPKSPAVEQARDDALPTLYLIGDSTVKVGTAGQRGWGEEIGAFFDSSRINVVNRAIGGRSSRTFLTDGRWEPIVADLKPGDVVLIQFGHNDGGPINDDFRARGTIRGIGDEEETIDNILTKKRETVHSYGWYLRKYVRDARAKGATPIVCSLVPRKIWEDGRIVRGHDTYAGWARDVAHQENALFLDLNEIIARGYERLGPEAVEAFFADKHTHTTAEGARFSAESVVAGLKALPGDPLAGTYSELGASIAPYER